MTAHVRNLVESCISCQQRRAHKAKHLAPLQRMDTPNAPMSIVHSDCIGPLPITFQGNRYIVTYVDAFSKWPEAYAVPSITSDVIAETLADFVCRYGSPSKLISDRGSNYVSQAMEDVYKKFGIKHITTTAYHPSSDGKCERLNRSLIEALSHIVSKNQQDWDSKLKFALLAIRTAVHSSTKLTPAAVMYGRNLNLPYSLFNYTPQLNYNDAPSFCELLVPALHKIYSEVYENLIKVAEMQEKYREKTAVIKNIKVGDLVWLNNPAIKKGQVKKLSKLNEGPYTVLKKLNDVNFVIAMESNLAKTQTVHVDRLTIAKNRIVFPRGSGEENEIQNPPAISIPESESTAQQNNPNFTNQNVNITKQRKRRRYWNGWVNPYEQSAHPPLATNPIARNVQQQTENQAIQIPPQENPTNDSASNAMSNDETPNVLTPGNVAVRNRRNARRPPPVINNTYALRSRKRF